MQRLYKKNSTSQQQSPELDHKQSPPQDHKQSPQLDHIAQSVQMETFNVEYLSLDAQRRSVGFPYLDKVCLRKSYKTAALGRGKASQITMVTTVQRLAHVWREWFRNNTRYCSLGSVRRKTCESAKK